MLHKALQIEKLKTVLKYGVQYKKVYIILLNYNSWWDTIECLESVLRNDYPNYQVIVLDNNSPNNSMEYIKAWADGKIDVWVKPDNPLRHLSFPPLPKPIPYVFYTREEAEKGGISEIEENVREKGFNGITTKYPLIFIQTGENLGFAGGNNVGIRYALTKDDCEYIWLLNNDTVIENDSLINLIEFIKPNIMLGSIVYYYNQPYSINSFGVINRLCHFKNNKKNYNNSVLKKTWALHGVSMLIAKNVFKKVGLINEDYFLYLEETDFCRQAFHHGITCFVTSKSKIYHKEGSSTNTLGRDKIILLFVNFYRFVIRNCNPYEKIFSLFILLPLKILKAAFKTGSMSIIKDVFKKIHAISAKNERLLR